ncbi:MAG: hypothetical protein J6K84_02070 [Oscillospiraceae bacterium]|nr:hypothetical protein [Oscillospiraceae bacterium]
MKSYEEMAKSVLKRRNEFEEERKVRKAQRKKTLTAVGCLALILASGAGVWALPKQESKAPSEDPIASSPSGAYIYNMTQAMPWVKAGEVRDKAESIMGVSVPLFLAYDGDIYTAYKTALEDDTELMAEGKIWLSERWFLDVYRIKDTEDAITFFVNNHFTFYKKQVDLNLGVDCRIVCTANIGTDFGLGDEVWSDEKATVYEAKRLQGESSGQKEYIVDISSLLKAQFPTMFGDDVDYGEYRWLALGAVEDAPADSDGTYVENTSHLISEESANYFGGLYLDDIGRLTVVLTEDTAEIRKNVCKDLGVEESKVVFVAGKYSYQYLNAIHEAITQQMMDKKVPFVVSCGVYEMENRVVVGVTDMKEEYLSSLRALDTLGGAIVFEKISAMTTFG